MIRSPSHYRPVTPDPSDDGSQSDLDLDVRELDPFDEGNVSASARLSRRSPEQGERWQIPLRNLRPGRSRREDGIQQERDLRHNNEALQGLLPEDDDSKQSLGPSDNITDDEAALLPRSTSDHGRKGTHRHGFFSRLFSIFHMFSPLKRHEFKHGTDHPTSPASTARHNSSADRVISVGSAQSARFPSNAISNAKYSPWSFVPVTLYNEFSLFLNMYFLLVALSQIIPQLRIGYLSTYIFPLAFVLTISLGKEAYDDIIRRRRDAEANAEAYTTLHFEGVEFTSNALRDKITHRGRPKREVHEIPAGPPGSIKAGKISRPHKVMKSAKNIKVGDIIQLNKDQRVPADLVLLKSYYEKGSHLEGNGGVFVAETPNDDAIDPDSTFKAKQLTPSEPTTDTSVNPSGDDGDDGDDGDADGEAFIRTDQLDGETDWKLRLTCPLAQSLDVSEFTRLRLVAKMPSKDVNEFLGTLELLPKPELQAHSITVDEASARGASNKPRTTASGSLPLSVDNTAWANTVLASSCTILGVVVYTGPETRQALSTSTPRSKIGLLEYEINALTKILCLLTLGLSLLLVALKHIESDKGRAWYVSAMRFLVLFSTIVPISMRVNLDFAKSVYSSFIQKDKGIPETVVRTSTIPKDLGRIEYLLSDKTGTLTQNGIVSIFTRTFTFTNQHPDMVLKRIHIGTVSFANEAMDEVNSYIRQWIEALKRSSSEDNSPLLSPSTTITNTAASTTRSRREIGTRVFDIVLALALCHNVTPTNEKVGDETLTSFQASSPDEVAIVQWCESVGLQLFHRDRKFITIKSTQTEEVVVRARILNAFPFTSSSKRMGIIVQFFSSRDNVSDGSSDGEIWFFQKGADTVMSPIVAANDWLDEETANMAREGLRTLVVGRRKLSHQYYAEFVSKHSEAALSLNGRDMAMADVVGTYLERNIELLGVTGVEDKLQKDVKPSLELLRNAGIKIWMLTGDKVETARCVAVSSKLVARGQHVHVVAKG